ncbi:aldo/keto reductase [Ktedonosporobacter rubrisoli]|uniref:Aldo/keto reductase n=1 Tax=Ktedonosporobacter rubrisoli TaxID=2509675 RepID=A0A4V0YYN4_KTERU|nr:aldo/keto reductase [Ktedonosporobacter rubrisoli]QBD76831.1 aldo/keto reductase [Ktedonosporobacter rubrisoli]
MTAVSPRTLGRSGIEVSALGMGCWPIAGITRIEPGFGGGTFGWGNIDDNESIRALHAARAAGITFFETADVYGGGHSELLLGRAFAERRQDVVLCTKFGFVFDPYTRQMLGRNANPEYVRRACEGSLQRMQTDYIDLYLLHVGEYDTSCLDDICDVLEKLVTAGKIRAYGWCTWPNSLEGVKIMAQREHCAAVEYRLNVLEDAPAMMEVCEEHDLASINLAPLAMGLLTGKITQTSQFPQGDVRHGWNLNAGSEAELLKKAELLREILTSDGRSVVQGALGWLLARNQRTIPIPGFKTVAQVEENAAVLELGPLKQQQMAEIEKLLQRDSAQSRAV